MDWDRVRRERPLYEEHDPLEPNRQSWDRLPDPKSKQSAFHKGSFNTTRAKQGAPSKRKTQKGSLIEAFFVRADTEGAPRRTVQPTKNKLGFGWSRRGGKPTSR